MSWLFTMPWSVWRRSRQTKKGLVLNKRRIRPNEDLNAEYLAKLEREMSRGWDGGAVRSMAKPKADE